MEKAMTIATITVIELLADGIISALSSKVVDKVEQRLRSEPARVALQQAIASAVRRYATSDFRTDIVAPLLDPQGVFSDQQVIAEVAKLFTFNELPDAEIIAAAWRQRLQAPTSWQWRDFAKESQALLSLIVDELRNSALFREAFSARDIGKIAESAQASRELLTEILEELGSIPRSFHSEYMVLIQAINTSSPRARAQVRDFSGLIAEKTQEFVGRSFVFEQFRKFRDECSSGYFVVAGDPGIGKSALTASLVRDQGYVHHFNIQSEGINTTDQFVRNICGQLAAKFSLGDLALPDREIRDAQVLKDCLRVISERLPPGEHVVIALDALDEADDQESRVANTLFLPRNLPAGIFVFATCRPEHHRIRLSTDCAKREYTIDTTSGENMADIRQFLGRRSQRLGIQQYITSQEIDEDLLVDHLAEKSEGNFMYLRYVLPEIERGTYRDVDLRQIPSGLKNYYSDHCDRMRQAVGEQQWFGSSLPVLAALTITNEPISLDVLTRDAGVGNPLVVLQVLEQWSSYLHKEKVAFGEKTKTCFRLYHASFYDFMQANEQVALAAAMRRREQRQDELLDW